MTGIISFSTHGVFPLSWMTYRNLIQRLQN